MIKISQSPKMIDCPQCAHVVMVKKTKITISTGKIVRYIRNGNGNNDVSIIEDICERCGGSGRITLTSQKMFDKKTLALKKKQKVIMREWLAQEKELVWGVKENG